MQTRSMTHAHGVAKRHLRHIQRHAPRHPFAHPFEGHVTVGALTGLEAAMVLRLFDHTFSQHFRPTPETTTLEWVLAVNEWVDDLVIWIIKYYGVNYGELDAALVTWLYGDGGIDGDGIDVQHRIDRELHCVTLVYGHQFTLQQDTEADIWGRI